MKKILIILAALLVATSLVACNNDKEKETDSTPELPTNVEQNTNDTTGTNNGTETPTEAPTEDNKPSNERTFEDKNDKIYIMASTGAANIRTETNYDADSIFKSLPNGTGLDRTGADDTWSRITYEGKTYYIANKLIVEKTVIDGFEAQSLSIVMKGSVNVRLIPGKTDDAPIGELKAGDVVEVVAFNASIGEQGWYCIKLGEDSYGYISAHSDYSEVVTEAGEEAPTEADS